MQDRSNNSFVRQAAILAAASLFVRILGFAYRTPLTNLIGDDGIGFYATAYGIYTFAIVISSGALPISLSKIISERLALRQYANAHRLFQTALILSLTVGVAVCVILWFGAGAIAAFFNAPATTGAIRALAPATVVVAVLTVLRGYFQGMKNARPTALSQVVEQVFKVVFSLVLAFILFDALQPERAVVGASIGTGIAAIAALVIMLLLYAYVRKGLHARLHKDTHPPEPRTRQLKDIVLNALPIAVGTGVFALAYLVDLQMIPRRLLASGAFDEAQISELVGQFTGKFILLTTLPVSLSLSISTAVIPEIAHARVLANYSAIRQKINSAIRISMILAIPSAVGIAVLAYPIIALLFPRFPGGGWLLQIGSASIVFLSLNHVLAGTLQGLGFVKLPIIAAVLGSITKLPINHFLIGEPGINVAGAVVSTVVCYAIAVVANAFFLYRKTRIIPGIIAAILKPTLAATGMGLACYVAYHSINMFAPTQFATLAALAIGMLMYLLFMCIVKGFSPEDLNLLPMPRRIKRWVAGF